MRFIISDTYNNRKYIFFLFLSEKIRKNAGTISGGTFKGQIQGNIGTISGGTFEEIGNAVAYNRGIITDGIFYCNVSNDGNYMVDNETYTGTIKGGTFKNDVYNAANCTIENGMFYGLVKNNGTISNGRFKGDLENTDTGIINGGTFSCSQPDTGTINGGIFNYVDSNKDGGGQDFPNPGNTDGSSKNSSSKELEEVKPVIIVVPEGQKYTDNVMEQLSAVPTDGKVVIDTKDWYCFNRTLAEKVTNMKNVTVTIKYKYQSKNYEVTIPAGSDVISLLDENGFVGFRYLDAVFGGKEL